MSVETLKEWASSGKLGDVDFSDNANMKVGDASLPATETVTVTLGDKSCQYTLGSIYLQIQNPSQSLVEYRKACKSHAVKDPVKASDKATVIEYFGAAAAAPEAAPETAAAAAPKPAEEKPVKEAAKAASSTEKKRSDKKRDRHREKDRRSDKKRSRSAHSKEPREKKAHKAIDPEKLFTNLSVVVGKREIKAQRDAEQAKLHAALSADGFQVTPEEVAKAKEKFGNSMVHEIPVGDSSSILKAGAGKDLKRVLTLYNETMSPKKSSKKSGAKSPSSKRSYLIGKRPIIILPKGMTAPITMVNAYDFFANSKFVPRDKKQKELRTTKQAPKTVFSRSINARLGGGKVEYELMDNPKSKLHSPKDWERIVGVIALGQSWQMKDWPGKYGQPVELFGRTYGFYIGMEGDKLPTELQGWSVKQARLNRDKRGLDSVTFASFWNGLDEWMTIHRPELLPQKND